MKKGNGQRKHIDKTEQVLRSPKMQIITVILLCVILLIININCILDAYIYGVTPDPELIAVSDQRSIIELHCSCQNGFSLRASLPLDLVPPDETNLLRGGVGMSFLELLNALLHLGNVIILYDELRRFRLYCLSHWSPPPRTDGILRISPA